MIYVVDSADRDRIGISKQELVSMLEVSFFGAFWVHRNYNNIGILIFYLFFFSKEEELKNAILVVLANKQDIEGAMSVTEVITS